MFSDVLLSQPLIKEKFNEALDIMNRAVSSGMGWYHTQSQTISNNLIYGTNDTDLNVYQMLQYINMWQLHDSIPL